LLFLISDGFGKTESLFKSLSMLRANNLDDDEIDFPFQNRTMFRSLEARDQQQLVDPLSLRRNYLNNFQIHQDAIQAACRQNRIDWIPVRTSESFSAVLATYLSHRGQA